MEQPDLPTVSSPNQALTRKQQSNPVIVHQMPHLSKPKLISSMRRAIHDVCQTRSLLQAIGPRPNHEAVDNAKAKLAEIEAGLAKSLEDIMLSPRPVDMQRLEYRAHQADMDRERREKAEKEKNACKLILQLDEMHKAYERMLKEAEERLVKIYKKAENGEEESKVTPAATEQVNEEVDGLFQAASGKCLDRIDLSWQKLRLWPASFGRIAGLKVMNLASNHLQVIPDSIAGSVNLEELYLASNLLESLPDSIGLLQNLKILDVSGNKLTALPDSISQCRSLVELDSSFNRLTYLPTNIGYELVNLQRLSISMNKIRSLPTSVGELRLLHHLDIHFNELRGLPLTFGKLTNLEVLNLSSNFNDLKELPDTFGDLINLKELDLSNNQIHALPDTFGRLDKLAKLNLDGNPLIIPPMEIVKEGIEAVKIFMAKRWLDILVEAEQESMLIEQLTLRWVS